MERRLIPIGRCLRELQSKIASGYPDGTRVEISDITVVVKEKGKAARAVELIPRHALVKTAEMAETDREETEGA